MLLAVPNLAEGRDDAVVARLAEAASAAGVLHVSADADHNRCVLWLGGGTGDLVEACVGLAMRALDLIDLRTHRGVHPRFGALDVLPMVPHEDTPMREAVESAHRAAAAIASAAGIPVYVYGEASPGGRSLPDVRRSLDRPGGSAAPDYGPARPHPSAGAVCVGARRHLVAFNVAVRAPLDETRRVARSLRETAGGLPGVRAIGVDLPSRGLTQVSTNLTEPSVTGPAAAFAAVVRSGLEVVDAEAVGLVPACVAGQMAGLPLRTPPRTVEGALSGR